MTTIDSLDAVTVIRLLQQFNEEVPPVVDDAGTAVAVVDTLLGKAGFEPLAGRLNSEEEAVNVARRLLALFVQDSDTNEVLSELLVEPPVDNRLVVGEIVAVAAVLGALVGWLQTKIDLKVKRTEGKADIEFEVHKEAASDSLLRSLAQTLLSLLRPDSGTH